MEVQSSANEDHTHSTPTEHALVKAKGDVLDRFWASVEPYCADITDTEINMLEEGMKSVNALSLTIRAKKKNIDWWRMISHKLKFHRL